MIAGLYCVGMFLGTVYTVPPFRCALHPAPRLAPRRAERQLLRMMQRAARRLELSL